MADPEQKSLTFDFNKAVERAKQDYPQAMSNVTFVDLDEPDAQAQIDAWVKTLSPKMQADFASVPEALAKMTPDSFGFAVKDTYGPNKIVAVHTQPEALQYLDLLKGDNYKQAAYLFLHELGHLAVPVALMDSESPFAPDTSQSENAADAFAFIEGMRQGLMTKQDAVKVASARLTNFMIGKELDHLTTASLDYVAVNPEKLDFMSLTPKEVAAIARTYAEVFGNTEDDNKNFSTLYAPVGDRKPLFDEMLVRVGSLAMKAPADSTTFYISARVMNMMFRTDLVDETKPVTGPKGASVPGTEYWGAVKDAIYEKMQKVGGDVKQMLETLVPVPARKIPPAIAPGAKTP